jgi:hypothetical protein
MGLWNRRLVVENDTVTSAVHLTLRKSLVPNLLGKQRHPFFSRLRASCFGMYVVSWLTELKSPRFSFSGDLRMVFSMSWIHISSPHWISHLACPVVSRRPILVHTSFALSRFRDGLFANLDLGWRLWPVARNNTLIPMGGMEYVWANSFKVFLSSLLLANSVFGRLSVLDCPH